MHVHAVGGGFEWLLNCDLVVDADNLVCFYPELALSHFVAGVVIYLLLQTLELPHVLAHPVQRARFSMSASRPEFKQPGRRPVLADPIALP